MPLAEQDRSRWDTAMIAEGVGVLQSALALERIGEYQAQAAIAAPHCDAATADETDYQVLEWYDELLRPDRLEDGRAQPRRRRRRGDGPLAGLKALDDVPTTYPPDRGRGLAARTGRQGAIAHDPLRRAAAEAGNLAERDHLLRRAARPTRNEGCASPRLG